MTDLKPSNLFLRNDLVECTTLLDFGIAHLGQRGDNLTLTGTVIGTAKAITTFCLHTHTLR